MPRHRWSFRDLDPEADPGAHPPPHPSRVHRVPVPKLCKVWGCFFLTSAAKQAGQPCDLRVPDDGKFLRPQRRRVQSPSLTPARLWEVESLWGWWIKPQTVLAVPTEVSSVTLPGAAGSDPSSNGFIVVGLQWAGIKSPARQSISWQGFRAANTPRFPGRAPRGHPLPQHPGHSHQIPLAFPAWQWPHSTKDGKILFINNLSLAF